MKPCERYAVYENLVYWVFHKYYPDFIKNEDLLQEGRIGLWRACLSYDDTKGTQFTTVATPYIRNAIRRGYEKIYGRSLGKRQLLRNARSIYESVTDDEMLQLQDILPGDPDTGFLDVTGAVNALSERDQKMLFFYIGGHEQKEIAKQFGVSLRTVSRALENAKRIFRAYI